MIGKQADSLILSAITEAAAATTPSTWTTWRATTGWAATTMAARSDRLSNLLMVTKLCYARLSFRPRCIVPPSRNTCNHCTLPKICLIYLVRVEGEPQLELRKISRQLTQFLSKVSVRFSSQIQATSVCPTKTQSNDRLTNRGSDIGILFESTVGDVMRARCFVPLETCNGSESRWTRLN